MFIGRVYEIVNTDNKNKYVGSTEQTLEDRFIKHKKTYGKLQTKLYLAFAEEGIENFYMELIEKHECNSLKELRKYESIQIINHNSINNGYNMVLPSTNVDEETFTDGKSFTGRVYKIINKLDGNPYIGSTIKEIEDRFHDHKKDSAGKNRKLYQAFNEIGIDNFKIKLIKKYEKCETEKELRTHEDYFIMLYKSIENGYNMVNAILNEEKMTERYLETLKKNKEKSAKAREEKEFYCDVCSLASGNESEMKRHLKSDVHHRNVMHNYFGFDIRYNCMFCNKDVPSGVKSWDHINSWEHIIARKKFYEDYELEYEETDSERVKREYREKIERGKSKKEAEMKTRKDALDDVDDKIKERRKKIKANYDKNKSVNAEKRAKKSEEIRASKKFYCKDCNKAFTSQEDLNRHLRRGEHRLQLDMIKLGYDSKKHCPACNNDSPNETKLKRHKKTIKHKNVVKKMAKEIIYDIISKI